ncbi:hypothetical protein GO986_12735 [Deinococcus sp. HMF7620]|uniref:Uncharacterized protein n=1 Tax=Deinococcus arboris TaxID=2682977 RepID=A0A7C9I3R2_9DEIO|nr:hypothetical protein [Deinococcus arboris]MVN87631.1 hypothetical protein [Deinococcus arboris]
MEGAKKVFEAQDENAILSEKHTPWTIDNLIYLDLELWDTIVEFVRTFSEYAAEDLEKFGTSEFTEDVANYETENLIRFRNILLFCLEHIKKDLDNLHIVMNKLELINPLIDEEYVRVCQALLTLVDMCIERNIFYYAWTE